MKFAKGYLKSLKTYEEFDDAFTLAISNNLDVSSARAVLLLTKPFIFLD